MAAGWRRRRPPETRGAASGGRRVSFIAEQIRARVRARQGGARMRPRTPAAALSRTPRAGASPHTHPMATPYVHSASCQRACVRNTNGMQLAQPPWQNRPLLTRPRPGLICQHQLWAGGAAAAYAAPPLHFETARRRADPSGGLAFHRSAHATPLGIASGPLGFPSDTWTRSHRHPCLRAAVAAPAAPHRRTLTTWLALRRLSTGLRGRHWGGKNPVLGGWGAT